MWRLRGGGRKRVGKGSRRTEKGEGGWQEEEGEMSIDVEDNLLSQDFQALAESHSRWFDKSINVSVCEGGAVGADTEHSMLDALVRRWCVSCSCVLHNVHIKLCTCLILVLVLHFTQYWEVATPIAAGQWVQSSCQKACNMTCSIRSAMPSESMQCAVTSQDYLYQACNLAWRL